MNISVIRSCNEYALGVPRLTEQEFFDVEYSWRILPTGFMQSLHHKTYEAQAFCELWYSLCIRLLKLIRFRPSPITSFTDT